MHHSATLTCPTELDTIAAVNATPTRSPGRGWAGRPGLVSAALAILFTGLMTTIGIAFLSRFHSEGPYRYDSAQYRAYSVSFYDHCQRDGRWATVCAVLTTHNSFDVVVRLLIWPELLRDFHGHLYIQVPLMAFFCWLTLHYVHSRSGSHLLGLAVLAVAFSFTPVYAVQNIMDYWKDSLAVWMLGSALLCWFMSEQGRRCGWSFASGLMWGLLVLQRPAIAVYGLALFAPLLAYAAYRRCREDDPACFVRRAAAFAATPLVLGVFAVIAQWESVYQYYFVHGYCYASPGRVADWLLHHRYNDARMASAVLGGLAICLVGSFGQVWARRADFAMAVWLLAGFVALMMATRTTYPLWPMVAMVLAIVSLARATPSRLSPLATRCVAAALLVLLAGAGFAQARSQQRVLERTNRHWASVRPLFDDILTVVQSEPTPPRLGLFFDQTYHPLWSQFYFDHGVKLPHKSFFMSIHDSSYAATYGDVAPAEIAASIVAEMEADPGTLVVVNRDVADLRRRLHRNPYAKVPDGLVFQVNTRIMEHFGHSPRWEVVREIDNAFYGPLSVYRCVP